MFLKRERCWALYMIRFHILRQRDHPRHEPPITKFSLGFCPRHPPWLCQKIQQAHTNTGNTWTGTGIVRDKATNKDDTGVKREGRRHVGCHSLRWRLMTDAHHTHTFYILIAHLWLLCIWGNGRGKMFMFEFAVIGLMVLFSSFFIATY